MADPVTPPVVSHDVYRRVIVDPNGQRLVLGGTEEVSTLAEDGSVHHERTDLRVMTLDGHVIDHEHGDTAHTCPLCGVGPYSRHAMTACQACRRFVCLTCATQTAMGVLCAACHKQARRQALWEYLRRIF
jgi:hypothetical protein